ncbi:ribonuclease H-like domain-containing protein [Tanacetum coccineum]
MITRSQSGIVKPINRLSLHTSSLSPIPKSSFIALKDPNWCNAMYDEYNALVKNGTWILVPRPSDYARQLLERAHMVKCNPSRTPIDTDSKLGPGGVPVQDHTLYRSLAGGLQYLTFTHPDLSYAVQQGTMELGLQLYASATTSLVGYTDADWAENGTDRRDTSTCGAVHSIGSDFTHTKGTSNLRQNVGSFGNIAGFEKGKAFEMIAAGQDWTGRGEAVWCKLQARLCIGILEFKTGA